jgi:hypothetical protein
MVILRATSILGGQNEEKGMMCIIIKKKKKKWGGGKTRVLFTAYSCRERTSYAGTGV